MKLDSYNGQLVKLTMDNGEELLVQPLEPEDKNQGTYRVRSFTARMHSRFDAVIVLEEQHVAAVEVMPEEMRSGLALTLNHVPDILQAYESLKDVKLPSKVSFGRFKRDDDAEGGQTSMYAVELFFDTDMDRCVRRSWRELHELGISSGMHEIEELRPHITVAVYNEVERIEPLLEKVGVFMAERKAMSLKFDVVGTFPTTRTLFLSPTITEELIQFHADYYAQCGGEWMASVSPFYVPGSWNPHCTLATKLDGERFIQAVAHVMPQFMPLRGETAELGVVKLHWREGRCVRSPLVKAYRFA
ncbi:2'-5' RNA ligase family protein [Paenibacillus spongiae]|uniref:2'-5' RNA ligase family protein n=1 Tax=Paenibacillus spongiae TaxID=2909671 RepID=A0ABY5SA94_9BACL|nr:2'-5' RNA ligase family protein [Paenibacillus spongiae]UVI30856.1 2'-5' RNA ligase family protein [Paenibacillus spongiae]